MKKSGKSIFGIIILSALVFCLLSGCGAKPEPECQHQWSEADCLNAGSCALCGEVQAEALGHNWAEASCESPEHCTRCGETRGEALSHSYGEWLLDIESMYRVCAQCAQLESAEIDYALYLNQHIFGRWNMCSKIENGRYYSTDMLPQHEADTEICFYEDGRVSSMGFEEKEISPSWSFDRGEFDSDSYQHIIYISFPENNSLSSACFKCLGDEVFYEIPLEDEGDMLTLSNSFGDGVARILAGTWTAWSEGSLYNINFSEGRSFTADIDGEISGFWQPRQPMSYGGSSNTCYIMLSYIKDGKKHSEYASLSNYNENSSQESQKNYMMLATYVNDTYTHFGLDSEEFLNEAMSSANTAHLGTWTSIDYIVSTPNRETYLTDEEKGLSTEYSITFSEDGSFSAKLNIEFEGRWTLREIRRENNGTCMVYRLTAPGINDYSYFQMYENGNGYVYISQSNRVSSNYSVLQMNEEEIAARNKLVEDAPYMVVGEWFCVDGQDFKAVFSEDGSFTISSGTDPEMYDYSGYWSLNTISQFQGVYTYSYDIETILDFGDSENAESTTEADTSTITSLTDNTEDAEPSTYREDYALRLRIEDNLYTLELDSFFVSGTTTNAEGLAIREEAASAVAGHWSSDSAMEYSAATNEGTEVSVEFYLDIAKDGSFTGYAGQNIAGFLEFYDKKDGNTRYLVSFSEGPDMDTLFTLSSEYLSAYIDPYSVPFIR